jgi:hypothetical protein
MPYDFSGIDTERLLRPPTFAGWLTVSLGFITTVTSIVGLLLVTSAGPVLGALLVVGICGLYLWLLAAATALLTAIWLMESQAPGSIDRTAILCVFIAPCLLMLYPLGPGAAFTLTTVAAAAGSVIPLPVRPLHDDWYEAAGVARPTGPTLVEMVLVRLRLG